MISWLDTYRQTVMDMMGGVSTALGLDQQVQDLDALQMVLRACVVFVFCLLAIKAAKRRFMGRGSAFDIVMIIILGSVISRAINGTAPMLPTLAASIALILIHRFVAWMSMHSGRWRAFVEGEPKLLVEDGTVDWDEMRKHDITEKDLHSALRQVLNTDDLSLVKHIYLEPDGKLSIVKR
ncbi:DUF421 domain-containing protein [Noviherbaspirillum massiliense]|uniref:DUF421 domain-containing protein n=1 Tax=Noviherbaspirillum massiliense TaxID=1465823 RepID=UPI000310A65F|nr:YetF domain-containing protein [Noviherbaspirillum massiliense]